MSRFTISIEDDSSTANPDVIAAVAEIPETQVEVEKSAADVAMQSGDVATCVSDIETAQDSIGTLSDIQQVLVEASTKTEGIDETTAVVTQIAVEAIYARLGMKAHPLPAMEVFASKHSRQVATKIAVESIGSTIKRIWEAIIKAIKLLIDKIKAFAQTFFQNRGKLENMVGIMKSRAKALEDSAQPGQLSASVSKAISLNFLENSATTHRCAHDLLLSIYQSVEYAEKISSMLLAKANVSFIESSIDSSSVNLVLDNVISNTFNFHNVTAKMKGDKSRPVLPLTHQRSIFIEENSDGFNFLTVKGVENTVDVKLMTGLKKSEILDVLSKVDELLKKNSKFDNIKKQQESALELLIKQATLLDASPKKDVEGIEKAQKQIRYLITLSGFISVTVANEYFSTIKTILQLVDESIKLNK